MKPDYFVVKLKVTFLVLPDIGKVGGVNNFVGAVDVVACACNDNGVANLDTRLNKGL
jgi:hypothetical protein